MEGNEAYIDQTLRLILDKDRFREAGLRATHLRTFHFNDRGDRVSLILTPVDFGGVTLEEPQRIEGVLADPEHALIDVKYVEGSYDHWRGETIGLAAVHLMQRGQREVPRIDPHYMAGDQGFGYFLPEDMTLHVDSKLTVAEEHIRLPALKYGRLAVDGAAIFDFLTY